jgi:hypothetical protein
MTTTPIHEKRLALPPRTRATVDAVTGVRTIRRLPGGSKYPRLGVDLVDGRFEFDTNGSAIAAHRVACAEAPDAPGPMKASTVDMLDRAGSHPAVETSVPWLLRRLGDPEWEREEDCPRCRPARRLRRRLRPRTRDRMMAGASPILEAACGPVVLAAATASVAPTHADAAAEQPRDDKGKVRAKPVADDDKQRSFGTSSSSLAERIAPDFPDVHARMLAGEYPSVRAAARDAGLRRPGEVDVDGRNDERVQVGRRLAFESQLDGLAQVVERFVEGGALAHHVDVEALGHVQGALARERRGSPVASTGARLTVGRAQQKKGAARSRDLGPETRTVFRAGNYDRPSRHYA